MAGLDGTLLAGTGFGEKVGDGAAEPAGNHQFARVVNCRTAGVATMRTRVASSKTATRPPISAVTPVRAVTCGTTVSRRSRTSVEVRESWGDVRGITVSTAALPPGAVLGRADEGHVGLTGQVGAQCGHGALAGRIH